MFIEWMGTNRVDSRSHRVYVRIRFLRGPCLVPKKFLLFVYVPFLRNVLEVK